MKFYLYTFLFCISSTSALAQSRYFPPLTGSNWEKTEPASLGWCTDNIEELIDFLGQNNTKAFIVLKDGKIAIEKYYGTFTQDSLWYWASAGKVLTSFMVGLAQEEGLLSIDEPSSNYLGTGWTSLPPTKEALINIRHQLTMTTGLDDGVEDPFCTLPACLLYKADAGARWAYHNGPYTLLDVVVEQATGKSFNQYFIEKVRSRLGMKGGFFRSGFNNVYISDARSMARFGLMVLNEGAWGKNTIMQDTTYFRAMTRPSQELNPSYGYLWWLNGQESYRVPQTQFEFKGPLNTDAPPDMFAALGKNGQLLNIVPSMNLVFVRMGNAPDNSLVPFLLNNQVWEKLNKVICNPTTSTERLNSPSIGLYPNPASDVLYLDGISPLDQIELFDMTGKKINVSRDGNKLHIAQLSPGVYAIRFNSMEKSLLFTKSEN